MSYNYCDQFCKNKYYFGTSWDIRCGKTDLIQNEEYHEKYKRNNMTSLTCKYAKDCLQYQFAQSVAKEIKSKIDENDKNFMKFLKIMDNKPKRTRGTKEHPITEFLNILIEK